MKGRVKKELEQLKPLTLKIQEVILKNVAVTKNEWMNEWINEWMNEWMNESIFNNSKLLNQLLKVSVNI